jgi:hypothetical protein
VTAIVIAIPAVDHRVRGVDRIGQAGSLDRLEVWFAIILDSHISIVPVNLDDLRDRRIQDRLPGR